MLLTLPGPRHSSWELVAVLALGLSAAIRPAIGGPAEAARAVIDASGFKGGLVVHLGCGDGALTAALAKATGASQGKGVSRMGCVIQGLDRDRAVLARRALVRSGRYGCVTAVEFAGTRLPYADNLVNLLVVDDAGPVPRSELMRVLAPGGALCMRSGNEWQCARKPRPDTIDEWTHYLHDASGNAVARDTVVGPPRRLQWVGGPRWARHHDRMASMNAMASAGGVLYYVIDQGPTEAILLPPEWTLVARDGFCGAVLWKRPLPSWHPHLWPMKSGFAQLPRRLVAVGGYVYLPLGMAAPLSCLDGATGEVVRTYPETHATEEVLWADGVLYVLANPEGSVHRDFRPAFPRRMWDAMRRAARDWAWNQRPRQLMALRADTGEVLWRREQRVVPLSLAVGSKGVFFHDGERVVRLDRDTGKRNWQSEPIGIHFPKEHFTGSKAKGEEKWQAEEHTGVFVPSSFGPTLVVHQDVVIFAGGDGKTTALSAKTGAELWSAEHHPGGHFSPQDLFVIGDRVWSGAIALPERHHSGAFTARNLRTGAVEEEIPCDTDIFFMHHRCHRAKATERYFIPSRTGIELIGLRDRHWDVNHWVRGGCLYGVMPCNGLLYVPPHSCACYMMGKLNGFNALKAGRSGELRAESRERLERGPAYGSQPSALRSSLPQDWPTYRHDGARSGATPSVVPTELKLRWRVDLGSRLSAPVVAGGRLYIAQVERHTLHAIDTASGRRAWSYTAGGRIDSPPTIYQGRVLFGCADGCIYALRATDGVLSWRFHAAPVERRIMSYGQLESAWPLHGSVLVQDGGLYAVAGRSMFLDGGLRLLKLDPATGALLMERVLDEKRPGTDDNLQTAIKGHNIPVALPDVLSSDGEHLFMRTQQFDLDGNRAEVAPLSSNQVVQAANQVGPLHLFSPIGFLDGSWWHRAYWVYGSRFAMGAGGYSQTGKFAPAGRILAMNESGVYGYGREPRYFTWTTPLEYRLFGAERQLKQRQVPVGRARRGKQRNTTPGTAPVVRWSGAVPLQVRGMVLTPDTLFTAGPPDVVDEAKVFHRLDRPAVQEALARQCAALKGREGAILYAANVRDGRQVAAYQLVSPPVWDGLAAAQGQFFLAAIDGTVSCLSDRGTELPLFRVPKPEYKQPDLVGHWTFDEGKGAVAVDSSERCNDALVRTQWTDGKSGACVRFSKPDDSVQIPDARCLDLAAVMTIGAWIKPDDQTAKIPMIVSKLGSAGRYIFRLSPARHLVALVWKGDERVATIQSDQALSKDWHHVAVTCDARETRRMRLYVDGELVKEQPLEREWGDPAGKPLSISGTGAQQYRGLVDEVRVYNRALSPDEVRKLAQTDAR